MLTFKAPAVAVLAIALTAFTSSLFGGTSVLNRTGGVDFTYRFPSMDRYYLASSAEQMQVLPEHGPLPPARLYDNDGLRTTATVLAIAGGAITAGFGIWHYFIPDQYGWLNYIDKNLVELQRAVTAANFFLSTSLTMLGVWSIIMPAVFQDMKELNAVWCWTMTALWTARVLFQVFSPQGTVIGIAPAMTAAFLVTDVAFMIPAVVFTF